MSISGRHDARQEAKQQDMRTGKIVDAEVWLAKRVRQTAIENFLCLVADCFENEFLHSVQYAGGAPQAGCAYCGRARSKSTGAGLATCPCKVAFYCDGECQKADRKRHKEMCRRICAARAEGRRSGEEPGPISKLVLAGRAGRAGRAAPSASGVVIRKD